MIKVDIAVASISDVDVYVDSGKKNINSVCIIDMLKPVAAHVKPAC